MARTESIQKCMKQDHTTGERNLHMNTSKWWDRLDIGTKLWDQSLTSSR